VQTRQAQFPVPAGGGACREGRDALTAGVEVLYGHPGSKMTRHTQGTWQSRIGADVVASSATSGQSGFLLGVRLQESDDPTAPATFFLDVDDAVRLTQIFGQASVLSAKFLTSSSIGLRLRLRPRVCGVRASRRQQGKKTNQNKITGPYYPVTHHTPPTRGPVIAAVGKQNEYRPSRRRRAPPRVVAADVRLL